MSMPNVCERSREMRFQACYYRASTEIVFVLKGCFQFSVYSCGRSLKHQKKLLMSKTNTFDTKEIHLD